MSGEVSPVGAAAPSISDPNLGLEFSLVPPVRSAPIPARRVETDVVESRRSSVVSTGGDPLAARVEALAQKVGVLEQRVAVESDRADHAEEARAADARKQAEELQKPGFLRGLIEIFEFIGRFVSPLFNAISFFVRLSRVAWNYIQGEDIDWKKEGLRLAGDFAGIFFPPAGAIANAGFNVFSEEIFGIEGGESEILGGVNYLVDGDVKVKNPARYYASAAVDATVEAFSDIKERVSPSADAGAELGVVVTPMAAIDVPMAVAY